MFKFPQLKSLNNDQMIKIIILLKTIQLFFYMMILAITDHFYNNHKNSLLREILKTIGPIF